MNADERMELAVDEFIDRAAALSGKGDTFMVALDGSTAGKSRSRPPCG